MNTKSKMAHFSVSFELYKSEMLSWFMKTNVVPVPVPVETHDERKADTEVSWPPFHTLPTPHCSENNRPRVWLCLSQYASGLKGTAPKHTEGALYHR